MKARDFGLLGAWVQRGKFHSRGSRCLMPQTRGTHRVRVFAMQKTLALTRIIYVAAAVMLSASLFTLEFERFWQLPLWLIVCAGPLLLASVYPRFLFEGSASPRRRNLALVFHGAGLILCVVIFAMLSPDWKNPLRDNDSTVLPL